MLNSIREIGEKARDSFSVELLREVSIDPKSGIYREKIQTGFKPQKEVVVSFSEQAEFQGLSQFYRLKQIFESKPQVKAMLDQKWPEGIPPGKALALENNGNLYVDVVSAEGKCDLGVGIWALSRIVTIKPHQQGCTFSSLCGEEHEIKDSHISLAISTTPKEEGLLGVCLRMMRIAVVEKKLLENARVLGEEKPACINSVDECTHTNSEDAIQNRKWDPKSFAQEADITTCNPLKFNIRTKGAKKIQNFDYNLRWLVRRLGMPDTNNIVVFNVPEHSYIAFLKPLFKDGSETVLCNLELQPVSSIKMYDFLPASAKAIVDKRWASNKKELVFGSIRVTPQHGIEYTHKLHAYFPSAEEVLAVLGAKAIGDKFEYHFRNQTFEFSEAECKLAALITPIRHGILGICVNIAHLSYFKSKYSNTYDEFLSRITCMAESGYVSGISEFLRNSVEHIKVARSYRHNDTVLSGIGAEIQAVYSEYQGVVKRNLTMSCEPGCESKKMYMSIAQKLESSEADIILYTMDQCGEKRFVKMIEVKNSLSALISKVYSNDGKKQFNAYFSECARFTNDCGDRCAFDIYLTNTDSSLLNRMIYKRGFFENLVAKSSIKRPKLLEFLEKKESDGTASERFSVREATQLALNEIFDLRDSLTDKRFPIRLWMWSSKYGRFVRFIDSSQETSAHADSHNE